MKPDILMVHYGELSTKGDNKRLFVSQLGRNIRHALKGFPALSVEATRDYTYVTLNGEDPDAVIARLQDVSGIHSISLVFKSGKDLDSLKKYALELLSQETRFPGLGRLSLGMNGKVMLLLSGGIDSPVAGYSCSGAASKSNASISPLRPIPRRSGLDKLKDLLKKLNVYQADIKLNVIPFTELQLAIYKYVDEPYCITIMRRMMMRIAVGLAKKEPLPRDCDWRSDWPSRLADPRIDGS
jgi:adenylyl- and sulfurtransferase ThiI